MPSDPSWLGELVSNIVRDDSAINPSSQPFRRAYLWCAAQSKPVDAATLGHTLKSSELIHKISALHWTRHMMEADMTLAKTLLAVTIAGLGVLAFYANENAGSPTGAAQAVGHDGGTYPGVGLGGLLQPLEH
jgi:hypothetical protein